MVKENEKMNPPKVDISIVIPIYRNAAFIDELYSRLTANLSLLTSNFEILFVNDGSPDHSWDLIVKNAEKDSRVKGIRFSRNFGQHIAVTAGVSYASGDWVVVMDGDLQDRPEEIINLYRKASEGYDVVFARRVRRKDAFLKRLCSALFYKLFDLLAGTRSDPTVASFGIYSRQVIDYFNKMQEHSRVFAMFVRWLGFKTAFVDVEHAQRTVGKSAYSFSKKLDLAIDAIVSMSNNPLKLSIKLGFFLSILALLYGVVIVIKYFILGIPVMGWTSLIVSIYFLGGLLLSTLGILGLYIGKIYDEVKNRPLYVIKDKVGIPTREK
jgi:dolichol-phosphate mannosyltransferase